MFYTFNQNNSGGSFDYDAERGISAVVIIEADSAEAANERAEQIGLYFDGDGDCECCGDRWYSVSGTYDSADVPSIYGTPLESYEPSYKWMGKYPETYVHYANGTVTGYHYGA